MGVQVAGDGDTSIKIGALVQTRAEVSAHGAPDGSAAADFYLRRMRLMLYGTVHPQVHFFIETDNPNFGRSGDWSGGMFIQDAWVEWAPHRALQLDAGLLLVPLSQPWLQERSP